MDIPNKINEEFFLWLINFFDTTADPEQCRKMRDDCYDKFTKNLFDKARKSLSDSNTASIEHRLVDFIEENNLVIDKKKYPNFDFYVGYDTYKGSRVLSKEYQSVPYDERDKILGYITHKYYLTLI